MSGFSIPFDKLAEKAKLDLDTVVKKATIELFSAVVRRSPVDTGRFRANWNVSQGTPDAISTDSVDQNRAENEIEKVLSFAIGGKYYLTNGLPYAARLENGYSDQAPAGMIRLSVTEYDTYVRKAIK